MIFTIIGIFMTDDILEHAINFIKSGDIDQGGKILVRLLKENPKLERAWSWLYACVKTDDQRIYCLKKVIEINPDHEKAKLELIRVTEKKSSVDSVAKPEITDIASNHIYKSIVRLNLKHRPTFKIKGSIPLLKNKPNKTKVSSSDKFKVAFIKPKVIFNNSDDNPYAITKYGNSDFPNIDNVMFGRSLSIGGISITANDYPKCISVGHTLSKSQCYICEFFAASDCPIRRDPTILREARTLFAQSKRLWQENRVRRDAKIDAIYSELKDHGRPLHYEVVAKIMKDRYPNLRLSATMILHLMGRHPEKFEWVGTGVFKAR